MKGVLRDMDTVEMSVWSLDSLDELNRVLEVKINSIIREALTVSMKDRLIMRALLENGGIQLRVTLPLGRSEDENPQWCVSLSESLHEIIGAVVCPDGEERAFLGQLKAELLAAVQYIDEVLRDRD